MTLPLPPDDGAVMPPYRHRQVDQLKHMFGDALPIRAPMPIGAPAFTPLVGSITTLPTGAVSWMPAQPPDFATATADTTMLHVLLQHRSLANHCRPRRRDRIAALKADIEMYGPRIGLYAIPIDTPLRDWTLNAMRTVIAKALALVPIDDPGRPDHDTATVKVELPLRGSGGNAVITLARTDNCRFFGQVFVADGASRAVQQWINTFGAREGAYGFSYSTLRRVDRVLTERLSAATTVAMEDATDDDDADDLDDIEKSARRALHGERNVPNTSRRGGGRLPGGDAYNGREACELLDLYGTLSPAMQKSLIAWARLCARLE